MADAKGDKDGISASWSLLTNLLDLLVDKRVLTNQDLLALAEAAHAEVSAQPSGKRGTSRLKALRDRVKARG